MKISPPMAAVMISWPPFNFSGLLAEVVIWKAPRRIRRRAMPPARPTASLTMEATMLEVSVLMQPTAVQMPLGPAELS